MWQLAITEHQPIEKSSSTSVRSLGTTFQIWINCCHPLIEVPILPIEYKFGHGQTWWSACYVVLVWMTVCYESKTSKRAANTTIHHKSYLEIDVSAVDFVCFVLWPTQEWLEWSNTLHGFNLKWFSKSQYLLTASATSLRLANINWFLERTTKSWSHRIGCYDLNDISCSQKT
jgi:hypothetical protein